MLICGSIVTILSVKNMLMPCEVAVKSLVPSLRSALARELIQSYGMRQNDVANLLGVTQTAVSKYTRYVRGAALKVEDVKEVQPTIKEIAFSLVNEHMSKYQLVTKLCMVCEMIRRKGLMCELCKRSDPTIDIQQCYACHLDPSKP